MIIVVFVLLAIPLGYALGGRLKNIKTYETRALGLPIGAFLLEAMVPVLQKFIETPVVQWHWMIVIAEYCMLFIFCFINRRMKYVWVIFIACLLNFFVIAVYSFQMPVTPYIREMSQMAETIASIESGEYFRYTIAELSDPFWFLGDVIVIPLGKFGGFASIGDVFLGLGCGWMFLEWMLGKKQAKQPSDKHKRQTA